MNKLEAFQIVGITLWYVLGAVSVPVGWLFMGYLLNECGHILVRITLGWVYFWTLYWIIQGWPKIGGGA